MMPSAASAVSKATLLLVEAAVGCDREPRATDALPVDVAGRGVTGGGVQRPLADGELRGAVPTGDCPGLTGHCGLVDGDVTRHGWPCLGAAVVAVALPLGLIDEGV